MATVHGEKHLQVQYPTSDGKPMAETDFHRDLMVALIETLKFWFVKKPKVYVSGNLLMYYVPGNRRKHVSPDVFVVPGVSKKKRLYYLTWEEGKNPACTIEITSSSTRREDMTKQMILYRDVLKVKEYFLFDPFGDYLKPQFQGYSLQKEAYVPIPLVDGRMPSKVLQLHLEPAGNQMRLHNPVTGLWLPTPQERIDQEKQRADQEKERADQEKERADQAVREQARLAEENARQRQQLEKLLREKKNGD